MGALTVRDATGADVGAITAITHEAILTTTANWNLTPVTEAARAAWLAERQGAGFPVRVAERGTQVIGFGSFGPFRPYEAYLHTVEHGLYVAPGAQRMGAGSALMAALADRAGGGARHACDGRRHRGRQRGLPGAA